VTTTQRRLLAAGRRAGWGVADQTLSSLTNVPLGLLGAHILPARDFGALSIVLTTYFLALGVSRAIGSEPLVVRFSGITGRQFDSGAKAAIGLTITLGAVMGLLIVAAGLLLPPPLRGGLVALGLVLPGLLFQDGWRFAFFASSRESRAFISDLAWTILLFPALLLLGAVERLTLASLVVAWGVSATLAGMLASQQARLLPRPRQAWSWLQAQYDLASRYAVEYLMHSGLNQMMWYVIGVIAGLASLGSLRAGVLLLGPLNMLSQGIFLVALPRQVRAARRADAHFLKSTITISMVQTGMAVTWAICLWLLPDTLGRLALGPAWDGARYIAVLLALAAAGRLAASGAAVGLRALAAANRSLRAGAVTSTVVSAAGVGGALRGGSMGAATAVLFASWLGCVVYWWNLVHAAHEQVLPRRSAWRTAAVGGGAAEPTLLGSRSGEG
jgi:O-antigen/teichoic acid export membrane protein